MRSLSILTFLVLSLASFSSAQSDRDLGIELFRHGKYTEAVTALEKSFETDRVDYITLIYLGASYVKIGNDTKAIETFSQAQKFKNPQLDEVKFDRKLWITRNPVPRYSDMAIGKHGSGTIRLAVEFKKDGILGFIFPFQTTSRTLIDESIETARQIRFKPAKIKGEPVSVVRIIEYSFMR